MMMATPLDYYSYVVPSCIRALTVIVLFLLGMLLQLPFYIKAMKNEKLLRKIIGVIKKKPISEWKHYLSKWHHTCSVMESPTLSFIIRYACIIIVLILFLGDVFLLLGHTLPLNSENTDNAQIMEGKVEKIRDNIIFTNNHLSFEKQKSIGSAILSINEEDLFIRWRDNIEIGDHIRIKYLPKSRIILAVNEKIDNWNDENKMYFAYYKKLVPLSEIIRTSLYFFILNLIFFMLRQFNGSNEKDESFHAEMIFFNTRGKWVALCCIIITVDLIMLCCTDLRIGLRLKDNLINYKIMQGTIEGVDNKWTNATFVIDNKKNKAKNVFIDGKEFYSIIPDTFQVGDTVLIKYDSESNVIVSCSLQ